MQYYFAPMEGITDGVYRKLHNFYYPGIDRYFTPFLSPTMHRNLTNKEQKEIPLADTLPYSCVPQILTKDPSNFLWLARQCHDRGYKEVNLNLGCPSGTVTAKGKGSGMLRNLAELDHFFHCIFSQTEIAVSVKTRIGFSDPQEFIEILEVFNRYPICELIIHPRVRTAFYSGTINAEAFQYALVNSRAKLCYNGDITALEQATRIQGIDRVMIGRGLIANPGMITNDTDSIKLNAFLNELLDSYALEFGSSRNAMFRLKEHWHYLQANFSGGEKLFKQLRKTTDFQTFKDITDKIFLECPFSPK